MMAAARLSDRELLRRLVAIDTTSARSNLPLADFVADYCDRSNVRIDRVASEQGDKANLVLATGPTRADRAGLVLSGHTDVVPPGDGWRTDPFLLAETEERLTARGACDMKGFLAIAINRLATAAERPLTAPLVLVFTYDEEVGTLGARRLAEVWPRDRALPRRVIVGEPTSLRPIRMHKGHLRLRLTVRGRSAHSGYPHLGVNAIEGAGQAILALRQLRATLETERSSFSLHFPDVPYVPLNIGRVEGGVAVNVVPERAVLDLGIRLLPGMTSAPFVERVWSAVAQHLDAAAFEVAVISESPPMALDAGTDHYLLLRNAGRGHVADSRDAEVDVGANPNHNTSTKANAMASESLNGVSFATDAGWLQSMGCGCVIWGPGSITVAHRPNEYLPVEEFRRAGETVDVVVRRFCDGEDQ